MVNRKRYENNIWVKWFQVHNLLPLVLLGVTTLGLYMVFTNQIEMLTDRQSILERKNQLLLDEVESVKTATVSAKPSSTLTPTKVPLKQPSVTPQAIKKLGVSPVVRVASPSARP